MKFLARLALASAWNRRWTLGLTLAAVALSVALLLGVERTRIAARTGFVQSVAGTDLIVGPRTGGVQLLLYSVFRVGNATNNISAASADVLRQHPAVAWTIPLSLGDSHRSFPVLGTSADYFAHFRYGDQQPLRLQQGRACAGLFEVVLGAEVAERLGYTLGQAIALSHGGSELAESSSALEQASTHGDKPFTVVGLLAPTGTPVDRTLHVTLESISALHLDWAAGVPMPGLKIPAEFVRKFDLAPKDYTAVLVGLKNRSDVFRMQRFVNELRGEPLLAILPGVTLDELWGLLAVAERALQAISALVVAVGLAGLVAVVLASLNERRRELAILRAVGARPRDVFALLLAEGVLVTATGVLLGMALLATVLAVLSPWVQTHYGIAVPPAPTAEEWRRALAVLVTGTLASAVPAWRAYRLSLADGLTPRI